MTGGSSSKSKSKGKSKGKGKQDSGGGGASVDYHDAMAIVNIESYWTEMQVCSIDRQSFFCSKKPEFDLPEFSHGIEFCRRVSG